MKLAVVYAPLTRCSHPCRLSGELRQAAKEHFFFYSFNSTLKTTAIMSSLCFLKIRRPFFSAQNEDPSDYR